MTQPHIESKNSKKRAKKTEAKKTSPSSSSSTLPVGRFCWYALRTPDLARSKSFYGDVLGWKHSVDEKFGMEVFAGSEGPVVHTEVHPGPASFLSYVVVDDVEAAARRVQAAAGKVLESAKTMPDVGTMQSVEDGDGAVFSLFQPVSARAAAVRKGIGAPIWNELWAKDEKNALAFLTAVVGYVVDAMPMPGFTYNVIRHGEEQQGGVMQAQDPSLPSAWVPYFFVVDVDAAHRRALAGGATELGEVMDVPNIGRMASLLDPHGARFAIMTPIPR
ncbi:MAG: VOC family protein [Deltaproteobacteria bacterium]|nr:VOC family protein [Deltaproteobacteria bacterium]